jgi:A/G-specific adenine glycosylase
MNSEQNFFTQKLLNWNLEINNRPMPWKGEKDPYKIWLSEIILQQTRVEQGWDYYNRFVKAFPDITRLAKAPETTVFKLWEGLGYYTRCKNLIATAKFVTENYKGKFPDTYEGIVNLKGVGPYTAAAIASFAYNLPYAVVDGNVFRVLSRFFGIDTPIDSTAGKKLFTQLANELLDKKNAGIYNQALMDFGAVVCRPKLPLCDECPLNKRCVAYLTNTVNKLPVKEKSITKKTRWFYYLLVEEKGKFYVRKRAPKDIWENLYEFFLLEKDAPFAVEKLAADATFKKLFGQSKPEIIKISKLYRQQLSHQTIQGQFIHVRVKKPVLLKGYETVSKRGLEQLPFPKFITTYLQDKNVSLNLF